MSVSVSPVKKYRPMKALTSFDIHFLLKLYCPYWKERDNFSSKK